MWLLDGLEYHFSLRQSESELITRCVHDDILDLYERKNVLPRHYNFALRSFNYRVDSIGDEFV